MLALQVAQAVSQQLMTLNTNVRYLHSSIVEFAEQLVATLPPELQVRCQSGRIIVNTSDDAR